MSDVGIYTALEGDLKTKLASVTGLQQIVTVFDVEHLVTIEGIRKPCIGIVDGGADPIEGTRPIGSRMVLARYTFDLYVATECARTEEGNKEARAQARSILEQVRDVLHGRQSGVNVQAQWTWRGDRVQPTEENIYLVMAARYTLDFAAGI